MMRAVTVRQPYAWAILHAGKDVENRTSAAPWLTAVGSTVAVHAAKHWHPNTAGDLVLRHAMAELDVDEEILPRQAIVGLVDVVSVHEAVPGCCSSVWAQVAGVHLVLDHPRPVLEPVPCPGMLGLWRVPTSLEARIAELAVRP